MGDGGSAFPLPEIRDYINRQNITQWPQAGLSKREWFAALAMGPLMATQAPGLVDLRMVATRAFQLADEMIEKSKYL